MPSPDALAALRRAAAVGPYFAVITDAPADASADPAWEPFADLLDRPDIVAARVRAVRATLAARTGLDEAALELRACASIHFLGLASRLVAPALAAVALAGVAVSAAGVRWQRVEGGPVPLTLDGVTGVAVTSPAGAAAALRDGVLTPLVAPLVEAFTDVDGTAVSPTVLWGNVASALAGAASMLLRASTPFALDPREVVTQLLTSGPLAGAGAFGVDGRFFRRTSCCLFYRVPGGGTCGDCVL